MAHLESEKDSLGSWNSKFVVKKNFSQPFPNSRELWKESFLNSTLFILLFIVFVDVTNKEIFYWYVVALKAIFVEMLWWELSYLLTVGKKPSELFGKKIQITFQ